MRKIESSIVKAIESAMNEPTEYRHDDATAFSRRDTLDTYTMGSSDLRDVYTIIYRLHGHAIFTLTINNEYGITSAVIDSCHHQTATTKSRLNAILSSLCAVRIYQHDFAWYVSYPDGTVIPFSDGLEILL